MKRTKAIATLFLSSWLFVSPVCGWCATTTATSQSITIPITQWTELKSELTKLNSELIQCRTDLSRLKKPSQELVTELAQAENMLQKLQQELEQQKDDLTTLSNEAAESKTLLTKLKGQIDKERRVHKRQVWQNRIWCFVGGAVVAIAVKR